MLYERAYATNTEGIRSYTEGLSRIPAYTEIYRTKI